MSFSRAIADAFSYCFVFSGRAVRSEFWWYILFVGVIGAVVAFVPVLGAVWFLANLLPIIALSTRRLHDTDRSGWWQLLPLISLPVLLFAWLFDSQIGLMAGGAIAGAAYVLLIVWFTFDGSHGENRFGKDAKGREPNDDF